MNEPKLRFKADDGSEFPEWEEKYFSEIFEKTTNKNTCYGTDKIISVANMYYKEDASVSNEDYLKTYNVMLYGDIAFEGHVNKEYSHGRFVLNDIGDGIVSHIFDVFHPKNLSLYSVGFWKEYIRHEPIMGRVLVRCTKSSTMMRNLVAKEFLQELVPVPCFPEQQKIAEFLSTIDTVIAKQKETVSAWEERKKGVMQKLFSQEVRFKADDGSKFPEWEEKKIDDLFYKVNERNNGQFGKDKWISVAKMYYQDEDKVTSNNIDTRTYVMRVGDMSFEGHPNKEFKYGRFVVNDIGDGIISELFPIYRHKENYILKYWKYAIQVDSIMQKIYRKSITSSGASSNKLDDDDFKRQSILVPCLAEQRKIADCLSSFDEVIEKQKATLAAWEELKKGLLQQMFV